MIWDLTKVVFNDLFNVPVAMVGIGPTVLIDQAGVLQFGARFPLIAPNNVVGRIFCFRVIFQPDSKTTNTCKKLYDLYAHGSEVVNPLWVVPVIQITHFVVILVWFRLRNFGSATNLVELTKWWLRITNDYEYANVVLAKNGQSSEHLGT